MSSSVAPQQGPAHVQNYEHSHENPYKDEKVGRTHGVNLSNEYVNDDQGYHSYDKDPQSTHVNPKGYSCAL